MAPDPTRRSERSRRAIHAAARDLVVEQGFAKVTIEAIAARAGVGKQTIYRWWPSKGAVVLDALVAESVPAGDAPPLPDTGDLAADLRTVLRATVAELTGPEGDTLLRAMTAEIQYDTDLAAAVRDRLLRPQMTAIAERVAAAPPTTPSGAPADPVLVAELLVGPIFHRWLLRTAPLDDAYADALVAHLVG